MSKRMLLRTVVTVALVAIPGVAAAKYEPHYVPAPPPPPTWTTNIDGLDVDPWGMRGETRTACGCVLPGSQTTPTPATTGAPRRPMRSSPLLDPSDPWSAEEH